MGIDIRFHTEVKINGQWHHYSEKAVERREILFEQMSKSPKGLPTDATFITLFDYEDNPECFDANWLDSKEIDELYAWAEANEHFSDFFIDRQFGYCFGCRWNILSHFPQDAPPGLEDVRFVFFFDR